MSFNKIKVGRLRWEFVCAVLMLALIGTGCSLNTEGKVKELNAVDVPADEIVDISWNAGWSPAISVTPGILFELRGSDDVIYELSGDTAYLCVDAGGSLKASAKEETQRNPGNASTGTTSTETRRNSLPMLETHGSTLSVRRKIIAPAGS